MNTHPISKPAWLALAFLSGLQFLAPAPATAADEKPDEAQLIRVLQSDSGPKEKDAACSQLKRIATAASVPALASLLTDEKLSHSARYVLEPMTAPEAGAALTEALGKTSGSIRVGIIDSLGARAEAAAAPQLAKLITDDDGAAGVAAAAALGRIATPAALAALQANLSTSPGLLHATIVDSLLECASRYLAEGRRPDAVGIFQSLYLSESAPKIRKAAFTGFLRSSGDRSLQLVITALSGNDADSKAAALGVIQELDAPIATKELASTLPRVDPPTQTALISGLSARGDPAAAQTIAGLINSPSIDVRIAAFKALGNLGDASLVPSIAAAAATTGPAQAAARQALLDLRHGDVTAALVQQLSSEPPAARFEAARALAGRQDHAAAPKLLQLAQQENNPARPAAFQALPLLVSESQLTDLVHLVTGARTVAGRAAAAEAFLAACRHLRSLRPSVDPSALVGALNSGKADVQLALFPAASGFTDPRVRDALRHEAASRDAKVREGAIRAMCATIDPELLPDLQKLAREAHEQNLKYLAASACVRLATQEESVNLPPARRLEILKALLVPPPGSDQKLIVLSGLAEVPGLDTLKLIEPLLGDPAVRAEAARAAIKAGSNVPPEDSPAAIAILKKAREAAADDTARQSADAAIRRIEASTDFITGWQVTAAYRQQGKDYAALFDIPFGPELAGTTVKWQAIPSGTDALLPCRIDFLKAIGGQQCVAYARTWVFSPSAQTALMELGSDDGIKVWIGDKLVHANNTARAVQPGSDKAKVELTQGWNRVLVKVTQFNQGWGFCLKLAAPDGSRLAGLKVDPAHGT
jgi:HEAT repeat protein